MPSTDAKQTTNKMTRIFQPFQPQLLFPIFGLVLALVIGNPSTGWSQDKETDKEKTQEKEETGNDDLDKAFDQKIKAQSTKDLDAVVKLCESAIEKGLDDAGEVQAKQLAASTLYEYSDQLGQRIFASGGQDRRWRVFRSQALKRLEKAIEFQPDMVEAHMMIAKLNRLPGGDEDRASEAIDKSIELAGDDREQLSNALFMRATLSDDEDEQLDDLNQAIKINPENREALRVRAAWHFRKDNTEKGIEDINKWLNTDGDDNVNNYLLVARSLMAMGEKFDDKLQLEALKIIDKAIELEPENVQPLMIRAQLNVLREKYEDAIGDVDNALEIDDKNNGLLLMRASIHSENDDLDKALEDVNKALENDSALPEALEMRGVILLQQEKFGEAIEDFKLLDGGRPNPFNQRRLAMLYNANDEPRKAIKIYDRLISQFTPELWEGKSNANKLAIMNERMSALRGRGDAQLSTGDHKEAIEDYEGALELADEIRGIQQDEGIEDVMPPDDGVLNNLAWVLATSTIDDLRDGERAIELATEAAEITEHKQAHILSTLASGYAEAGDFDKAIEWIEKAIEVNREEGEKESTKRNAEQKESLQKEYESYQKKEAWREMQDVEKDKKKDAGKPEKDEKSESKKDDDSDDDSDEDSDDDDKKANDKKGDDKKADAEKLV